MTALLYVAASGIDDHNDESAAVLLPGETQTSSSTSTSTNGGPSRRAKSNKTARQGTRKWKSKKSVRMRSSIFMTDTAAAALRAAAVSGSTTVSSSLFHPSFPPIALRCCGA